MKRKDITKVFEKIAAREGVSVAEIRAEIQKAIDAGLVSPNPAVQQQWSKLPYKGDKPTPEDVIAYVVGQIKAK